MLSPLDYKKLEGIDMSMVQSTSMRHAIDISIPSAKRAAKRTKHRFALSDILATGKWKEYDVTNNSMPDYFIRAS